MDNRSRVVGPLSPQRTAQVGIALLNALRAAYACDIVHRDVSGVSASGTLWICAYLFTATADVISG